MQRARPRSASLPLRFVSTWNVCRRATSMVANTRDEVGRHVVVKQVAHEVREYGARPRPRRRSVEHLLVGRDSEFRLRYDEVALRRRLHVVATGSPGARRRDPLLLRVFCHA